MRVLKSVLVGVGSAAILSFSVSDSRSFRYDDSISAKSYSVARNGPSREECMQILNLAKECRDRFRHYRDTNRTQAEAFSQCYKQYCAALRSACFVYGIECP